MVVGGRRPSSPGCGRDRLHALERVHALLAEARGSMACDRVQSRAKSSTSGCEPTTPGSSSSIAAASAASAASFAAGARIRLYGGVRIAAATGSPSSVTTQKRFSAYRSGVSTSVPAIPRIRLLRASSASSSGPAASEEGGGVLEHPDLDHSSSSTTSAPPATRSPSATCTLRTTPS